MKRLVDEGLLKLKEWGMSREDPYQIECGLRIEDPVQVAVDNKQWELCKYLVSQDANAWPYVIASAKKGDLDEVMRLVEECRVEVNTWSYWCDLKIEDPNTGGIQIEHIKIAKYLTSKGANAGPYLIAAIRQGDLPEVQKLVSERQIDLKHWFGKKYIFGEPVHVAVHHEHWNICHYLISQGAMADGYIMALLKKDDLPELKKLVEKCGLMTKNIELRYVRALVKHGDVVEMKRHMESV